MCGSFARIPSSGSKCSGRRNCRVYLGRFISEDPVSLGGGINQYAFAGDDPINGSDPSGLCEGVGCTAVNISRHADGELVSVLLTKAMFQ